MLSIEFWKGALERAVKTFFQVFVAVVTAAMGAEALGVSAGLLDVSWLDALSVAGLTAVLSVATSIGNADFTAGRVPVQVQIDTDAVVAKINENPDAYLLADETPGKHVLDFDPTRYISFDTEPDLTGEVGIYVNGEKIDVAPIINQRVLYKLPELPTGDNKVSAVHPERGVLYTFTFDS